jgi:HK97 family phage major capsid protein
MALGVTSNNSATAEGSALTVEQVQRILVQPLEQASVFLSSGVRIFDTDGSPVRLPKQAAATSPGWYGENEQIGEVNPEFDEIELLPSTMKSIKVITRFSNELARQSVIALDSAIQQRLVTDVASALDAKLIAGTGTSTEANTPKGILHYADVQTMTAVGDLTLDDILDAYGLALAAHVNPANIRLMMRSETYTKLRKIKEATNYNTYALGGSDATQAVGPNVLGIPVTLTNRVPTVDADPDTTQVVLWDPSQVAVARDLAPSVRVLTERYADFDQVALRVVARYDAGPLNAQAIVRMDNVTL